jgi:hypothetical protein
MPYKYIPVFMGSGFARGIGECLVRLCASVPDMARCPASTLTGKILNVVGPLRRFSTWATILGLLLFPVTAPGAEARSSPAAAPAEAPGSLTPLGDRTATPSLALAIDAGVGVGILFATHGRLGASLAYRLWDRFELEGGLRMGLAGELLILEPAVRAGILLLLRDRIELLLGWRVGYAWLQLTSWSLSRSLGAAIVSVVVEVRYQLNEAVALRVAPIVISGYWDDLWAVFLEPTLGVAYRF